MPFNLRSFDSETKAKMGVVECVTHKLVEPFQVLHEKDSKTTGLKNPFCTSFNSKLPKSYFSLQKI